MTIKRNFHGYININKDSGPTSSFIVSNVKRLINAKNKVGHCGTLDPIASGVLPICVGQATRLSEFFLLTQKSYRVTGKFGSSTDTYDSTGNIIKESDNKISRKKFCEALKQFNGSIEQRPPLFSALKHKGERLYNIARKGGNYIPPKRRVEIFKIRLQKYDFPEFQLDIRVSSGFYVRSLINDLGELLDCPSHMIALNRTSVGDFHLTNSIKLNELDGLIKNNQLNSHIISIDYVLKNFPRIDLSFKESEQVKNGVQILLKKVKFDSESLSYKKSKLIKAYDSQSRFIAILKITEDGEFLKPEKVFHEI